MTQGSISEALAAEISLTPSVSIPADARSVSKRMLIDHVGITYMGAAMTEQALLAYARELGGRATLIGFPLRVPAELAAVVNGQNCRANDFNETGPGTDVGPRCVHTALAVGQRT
ncbi:MAG: MmgE/PrpD family protein [Alphaproteobacteria bacterium]|nr:MmgE/PrpD family protein [Alphaproteobacteria bacterium]